MARNTYVGPWQDSSDAAITAALSDVNVSRGEYVECMYSDGFKLEPINADKPAIDIEVIWSEPRMQYKAKLRKVACQPM